jgi:hypothetical protein
MRAGQVEARQDPTFVFACSQPGDHTHARRHHDPTKRTLRQEDENNAAQSENRTAYILKTVLLSQNQSFISYATHLATEEPIRGEEDINNNIKHQR